MDQLNLIRLFDFYLAAMLLLSVYRRRAVYLDGLRIFWTTAVRRRKLIGTMSAYTGELLTAAVLRPVLLAVGLMLIQIICSRVLWPHANLVVADVFDSWWQTLLVFAAFVPMFAVDLYFLICVGRFDRRETEKYLDQAENWLGSWKGTAVRVATLGYINPTRMVHDQVRQGLRDLGATVGWVMGWVAVQVACRTAFGLTVWLLWVFGG